MSLTARYIQQVPGKREMVSSRNADCFRKAETLNRVWWQYKTRWKHKGVLPYWRPRKYPTSEDVSSESWRMSRSSLVKWTKTGASQEEKTVHGGLAMVTRGYMQETSGKWDCGKQGRGKLWKTLAFFFSSSPPLSLFCSHRSHLNRGEIVSNLILKNVFHDVNHWRERGETRHKRKQNKKARRKLLGSLATASGGGILFWLIL